MGGAHTGNAGRSDSAPRVGTARRCLSWRTRLPLGVAGVVALFLVALPRADARSHRVRRAAASPLPSSPVPTATVEAPPPPTPIAAGPHDPADLGSFLDGLVGGLMAERHVPGAAVLAVRDGAVLFSKGYGLADLEDQRPVDPATTVFRVASISKLFTATAVMQLVEAGKLDLQADVNRYLEAFTVPDVFGTPVTVANLLTHTAGFDDDFLGVSQPLERRHVPLGRYLARHMPARVMPPGEIISYSNHGYALAGYLVEHIAQQPFAEYVGEHILDPLGMSHSGFGLPTVLPPEMAVPYDYQNGRYVRMGYDRLLIAPAGGLYTTAADMARFMIAHLQDGRFEGRRILDEATAREMHRQQFTHNPRLTGWCYGFEENRRNDVRTIEHSGDWRGFGAVLVLVPEAHFGLFVSTNRGYDPRFFDTLLGRVFDRYFPRAQPLREPRPPADFAARAERYTGSYVPVRHVRSNFLKLGLLLGELRVSADDDGLRVDTSNDGLDPLRLVELEPELFAVAGRGHDVAFRDDALGQVRYLLADARAFEKVPWIDSPRVQLMAVAVCAIVFWATAIGWLLGSVMRRASTQPASGAPAAARRVGFVVALLDGTFLVGLAFGLTHVSPYTLFEGIPAWLEVLCAIPLLSLPLSLGLVYYQLRSLTQTTWTPLGWLHYLVLTLAAGFFAWWVYYWNLLRVWL